MKKLAWIVRRWIRQYGAWFKCDECGKTFSALHWRIRTNAMYGDVWCVECYAGYIGAETKTT